jgi:hypothetical protein
MFAGPAIDLKYVYKNVRIEFDHDKLTSPIQTSAQRVVKDLLLLYSIVNLYALQGGRTAGAGPFASRSEIA